MLYVHVIYDMVAECNQFLLHRRLRRSRDFDLSVDRRFCGFRRGDLDLRGGDCSGELSELLESELLLSDPLEELLLLQINQSL